MPQDVKLSPDGAVFYVADMRANGVHLVDGEHMRILGFLATGKGAHGANPQFSVDPVLVACHIGAALQSIVARNIAAMDTAVLSITRIQSGDAYNVIPQTAVISGTARTFKRETMQLIETNMRRVAEGVAAGLGASAVLDFRVIFAPLINDPAHAEALADAAASLVGEGQVDRDKAPGMGSEDFSFMME